tara:strand:+ start:2050 stop:2469 length:420 start_codon:yes stop_codon:yes gene_type:complete
MSFFSPLLIIVFLLSPLSGWSQDDCKKNFATIGDIPSAQRLASEFDRQLVQYSLQAHLLSSTIQINNRTALEETIKLLESTPITVLKNGIALLKLENELLKTDQNFKKLMDETDFKNWFYNFDISIEEKRNYSDYWVFD